MIEYEDYTNITLTDDITTYDVKFFTFSGGEEHVQLPPNLKNLSLTIKARLTSSSDVMRLALLKDAIGRTGKNDQPIHLEIPYVPYARQDRVCNRGESLAIKVFCDIINRMDFDSVSVADVHSDVALALLNRVVHFEQYEQLEEFIDEGCILRPDAVVVPDAGAMKKSLKNVTEHWPGVPIVTAEKVRCTETGDIIRTSVADRDLAGQKILIMDDICDGGRTFIELAKVLKNRGVRRIELFVTHGIFSKGTQCLVDAGIDWIYTTDSVRELDYDIPNVTMRRAIVD